MCDPSVRRTCGRMGWCRRSKVAVLLGLPAIFSILADHDGLLSILQGRRLRCLENMVADSQSPTTDGGLTPSSQAYRLDFLECVREPYTTCLQEGLCKCSRSSRYHAMRGGRLDELAYFGNHPLRTLTL